MSARWVLFCKRTEDPKLSWIERELDKLGIPHTRDGHSFHGPCLYVPEEQEELADSILSRRCGRWRIDDIRDDHPRWLENNS